MPRFFFDFYGDGEFAADQDGCEFESFELAYLDAFQSMVRIGAEQVLEQRDPSAQWIEIRDASRRLLATLLFDEVFSRRRTIAPGVASRPGGQHQLLREDIAQACVRAKESAASARRTTARLNRDRAAMRLGW